MKIAAVFLAISFVTTMFSIPSMVGTANAQSGQGSESACGPGFTLQQGQCVSDAGPTPTCPQGGEPVNGVCIENVPPDQRCPAGTIPDPNNPDGCLQPGGAPSPTCQAIGGKDPVGNPTPSGNECKQTFASNDIENRDACRTAGGTYSNQDKQCTYPSTLTCPSEFPILLENTCYKEVDKENFCPQGTPVIVNGEVVSCDINRGPVVPVCPTGTSPLGNECVKKPGNR